MVMKRGAHGTSWGCCVEDASGHHYNLSDRVFQAGQTFKLHTGSEADHPGRPLLECITGHLEQRWRHTVKVLDPQGHVVISCSF